jgi:hypothetical protein
MANELILGRALDANGYVMPGAKATVYAAGTSTLIPVYSNPAGSIAAANPIEADGNGFWPQRYVDVTAKVVVTDAANASIYTLDPAATTLGIGAAADGVSFNPTVAVPFSNVQAAIEGVAGSVLAGVSAFGIGITGNAPLLANLDATTLAAGIYRFDGTTTGTFPTGVTAANTGLVEMWRMTGSAGQMELLEITTNRRFRRRMTGSAWQIWREDTAVSQGSARGDMIRRGASDWERFAKGTTGQALVAGADDPTWRSVVNLQAAVAAASQTGIPFTGIPAWVNRVNIHFAGLSTNGTSSVTVRIGDSGGLENSGYAGTSAALVGTGSAASTFSMGFTLDFGSADTSAATRSGTMTLHRRGGNEWSCMSTVGLSNTAAFSTTAGGKTLSDTLTQLAVTTVNGSDTFDAGSVSISWE